MEVLKQSRSVNTSFLKPLMFLPTISLLCMFYLPVLIILINSFFSPSGVFTFDFIIEALTRPLNLWIIQFTLNQAFLSTFLTLLLGLPGAYIFARFSFKGKDQLRTLLTIPFVLPPIVVVLGFIVFLGPEGLLNTILQAISGEEVTPLNLYKTYEGIIIVHSFYNIPIVLRLVSSAWSKIDVETEEVATTLGSKGLHFFKSLIFPQISSALLASAILTFLYCFTSFAIVLSLGGIQFRTIEVQIYSLFFYRYDYSQAAALALIQLIITSILIILYLLISEKPFQRDSKQYLKDDRVRNVLKIIGISIFLLFLLITHVNIMIILLIFVSGYVFLQYGQTTPMIVGEVRERLQIPLASLYHSNKVRFFSILTYIVGLSFFLLIPIILIFGYSLYDPLTGRIGLSKFFNLIGLIQTSSGIKWLVEPIPILGARTTVLGLIMNSILLAILAMVFSSVLGILSVYIMRRSTFFNRHGRLALVLSWSLLLPLVTSSITMGLGLLRVFTLLDLPHEYSWFPIVIAHIIAAYPFVSRTVSTSYNKISFETLEISQTLGASRWFTFRHIELPLLVPGVLAGAIFAIAISFGEFGATYLMARSEFNTMTIGIYKFLESRQLQESAIMASILIVICIIAFFLIQKTGNEDFYL
ncbi:MAG: ABC transporter permease [Candidatus Hodarchaeales archaeon]